MARILIFDGAARSWQERLVACGAPTNRQMFERALSLHDPDLAFVVQNVADGETLPRGETLDGFDGVVVTGSPLNIYRAEPAVTRQIDGLRAVFAADLPVFGSCWGLQLGTVALGGEVRLNPKGRELGIARTIAVTKEGEGHPLFAGKAWAFDALCSHQDEVATVPEGGRVLAANGVSAVQALAVERPGADFTGTQYHPELTFAYTAAIIDTCRPALVREGLAQEPAALDGIVADFYALDAQPSRRDLAWRHGLDGQVLDPALRSAELGNWVKTKVLLRRARRAAAA